MEETKVNMPLLGDDFPELNVQTTHGPMSIPNDLNMKSFMCSKIVSFFRK
jgi:peroxiredoxin (alkyl hydroperoxide reductase subunit C)